MSTPSKDLSTKPEEEIKTESEYEYGQDISRKEEKNKLRLALLEQIQEKASVIPESLQGIILLLQSGFELSDFTPEGLRKLDHILLLVAKNLKIPYFLKKTADFKKRRRQLSEFDLDKLKTNMLRREQHPSLKYGQSAPVPGHPKENSGTLVLQDCLTASTEENDITPSKSTLTSSELLSSQQNRGSLKILVENQDDEPDGTVFFSSYPHHQNQNDNFTQEEIHKKLTKKKCVIL